MKDILYNIEVKREVIESCEDQGESQTRIAIGRKTLNHEPTKGIWNSRSSPSHQYLWEEKNSYYFEHHMGHNDRVDDRSRSQKASSNVYDGDTSPRNHQKERALISKEKTRQKSDGGEQSMRKIIKSKLDQNTNSP